MKPPAPAPSSQPFDKVLEAELRQMKARRHAVFPGRGHVPGEEADPHVARPFGVSFSGGGIRSATFNLGVIQGLAERGLLRYIDYLSTVSGGGYIGSWLHGVIRNIHAGNPKSAEPTLSPLTNPVPGYSTEDPISFLRKFANYLAPRPGLFSADTWVMGLIWLRNLLLNQLILIPALSSVIFVAVLLVFVQQVPPDAMAAGTWRTVSVVAGLTAFAALAIGAWISWRNLNVVVRQFHAKPNISFDHERWEHASVMIPPCAVGAAVILACFDVGQATVLTRMSAATGLFLLLALFQYAGGFQECYIARHPDQHERWRLIGHIIWMSATSAAVGVALLFVVWNTTGAWAGWNRIAFGPPLVSFTLITAVGLHLGLMGADYPDAAREWIARVASAIVLTCLAWSALFVLAVHLPKTFAALVADHGAVAITTAAGWIATTAAGVWAGRSAAGRADEHEAGRGRLMGILAGLAPTLFMVGYLMLLSFGAHAALVAVSPPVSPAMAAAPVPSRMTVDVRVPETAPGIEVDVRGPETKGWLETKLAPWKPFAEHYYDVFRLDEDGPGVAGPYRWDRPLWLLAFLAGCVLVTVVASFRININEFSLHHFYKNRLVRCYLGASHTHKRKPNSLTGFDPADDFAISALVPSADPPYWGPYAIVNVALNVSSGAELATQQRKAMSFVFTPEYCGFTPAMSDEDSYTLKRHKKAGFDCEGYRATRHYSYPAGPALGTAMSISGAAANPNSGHATSGPMAFLLTVFDARLGWWLGNPRWSKESKWPGPGFALKYLLSELLGQTTARSRFVNLSDGGHFDNLGLYELVRRRCRYIIVGDAEQDGDLSFGSLGGAIRKCRADFGVEIDINPDPIRLTPTKFSKVHCVVGTINYPEPDPEPRASIVGDPSQPNGQNSRGWLLYLKSSLTGDEPADVIEYQSRVPEFPHESTADQFFSESQFESYRRLGLHVVRDAFEDVPHVPETGAGGADDLQRVFQQLTRKWYAPPSIADGDMSRLNDAYSELMRRLGEKDDLQELMADLIFDAGSSMTPEKLNRESRMLLIEIIQLMENVFTEYRLEHAVNRANPRNAGWMTVFRRWAQRPVLKDVWKQVEKDYNPAFRRFMNDHLTAATVEDVPIGL